MSETDFNEIFTDTIRRWRSADSQRQIFGTKMPQTQKAIAELVESLKQVFDIFPSFSLVKKDQAMVVVVKLDDKDTDSEEASFPANLPAMPKLFTELKIDSITVMSGITQEEMSSLFTGISLNADEVNAKGGLNGFLKEENATHINVDQLKFKLLRDGEQVGPVPGGASLPTKEKKKADKDLLKQHDSLWKEYIKGKLDKEEFKDKHKNLIEMASNDPKQLEKILKRMMARQKEAEKFLAQLEQKLYDVGFEEAEVTALRKKLLKPKKVLIEEDELARLRKIEKEYLKSPEQRVEGTIEVIEKIKKKLSEETERSEAIMHQLGQGGMILDKNGKIVSVNETAQKVLGLREQEVLGKTVKEILKPYHILTAVSDWQKESETFTPKEINVQALNDETLAIIRESAIVIENENGRSIGVLSALQNIVQQEELDRRKNDILDVLGHDLRAPLSAIKMNFEVLAETTELKEKGTDQEKKFLSNCHSSIARMNSLIEKILDTRQLETGKILLKYDTVEMNTLIEQAATSFTEWANNKKITLEVKAEQLPDIDGDSERIYQIVTNLVSNALKFTPEGGQITVTGKTVEDNDIKFVEIAVKDSGMGIDKENLEKIFDKYEQVTVNAPKGVRGLGLGLSICSAIIELHGGNIKVESELEKGSTFTLQVPVKRIMKE